MRSLSNIIKREYQADCIQNYTFREEFELLNPKQREKEESAKAIETEEYLKTADIFEDALNQIDNMLAGAREEAERIKAQAYEDGKSEGYDAGYEEGYQKAYEDHSIKLDYEMKNLQRDFAEIIEDVTIKKDKILEKYIDDLKRVSLAIAEKVIQTSLKTSGEVVKRMILSATGKLKKTQWVKIYIAKTDMGITLQGDVELMNELSHLSNNIKIITMDNADEGTCIIELPEEIIDVSVNTQLENIKDILKNARL